MRLIRFTKSSNQRFQSISHTSLVICVYFPVASRSASVAGMRLDAERPYSLRCDVMLEQNQSDYSNLGERTFPAISAVYSPFGNNTLY